MLDNIQLGFRFVSSQPPENYLLGAVATRLELSADKTILRLHLDMRAPLYLVAVGDCCSKSWYEHISGIQQFLRQPITGFEDVPMPEVPSASAQPWEEDLIQSYGVKLQTPGGVLFIEFRNASNGYYGGNLDLFLELDPQYIQEAGGLQPLEADF